MLRLAVRVRREQAEVVLAELLSLAPSGVEEVALDSGVVEYAVYGAPGELPALPDLTATAGPALVEVTTSEVADDWDVRWRSFHRPLVLGDRLAVRPPWEPPVGAEVELVIDPGRAFGTGGAVLFKGSGFYETDYRSESYKAGKKAETEATKPKSDETKSTDSTPKSESAASTNGTTGKKGKAGKVK